VAPLSRSNPRRAVHITFRAPVQQLLALRSFGLGAVLVCCCLIGTGCAFAYMYAAGQALLASRFPYTLDLYVCGVYNILSITRLPGARVVLFLLGSRFPNRRATHPRPGRAARVSALRVRRALLAVARSRDGVRWSGLAARANRGPVQLTNSVCTTRVYLVCICYRAGAQTSKLENERSRRSRSPRCRQWMQDLGDPVELIRSISGHRSFWVAEMRYRIEFLGYNSTVSQKLLSPFNCAGLTPHPGITPVA
jgi:hypothetical protein